ncbi:MAG: hypothetical protein F2799_02075 [Actinobacteria bacterium]|uniref:Unannotated protein n=1 Tax=freshwater metagenome TaxID=449393 RepID=A0A6J7DDE4_9ZZZZ|nr:hypothetical protein [Actinomycetota bacterium]
MTRRSISIVVAATTVAVAMCAVAPAGATTPPYTMQKHVYGKRYCEMAAVFLEGQGLKVDIYNSFNQSTCPTSLWNSAITGSAMNAAKTALGAIAIATNGPRWWSFDEIGGVMAPQVVKFGNLGLQHAAVLHFAGLAQPPAFTEFQVIRTSTWVWNKGTYVRVLTSPAGRKFIMQSWTTQVSTKVTASKVNTLATGAHPLLTLPAGWKYKAYKATKKVTVVAPGTMQLVQDNLKNVYSRLP